MADACKICCAAIQGKHYRTLSTSANIEKYSALLQTLGMDNRGKACYICVNKLNKIVNLETDILSKKRRCEHDVQVIYSELQKMTGVNSALVKSTSSTAFTTPTAIQGLKRQRTPQTPTAGLLEKASIPTKSVGTQTRSCVEEFDVKVLKFLVHKLTHPCHIGVYRCIIFFFFSFSFRK